MSDSPQYASNDGRTIRGNTFASTKDAEHIFPMRYIAGHVTREQPTCPCGPTLGLTTRADGTGAFLVTHKAMSGDPVVRDGFVVKDNDFGSATLRLGATR